MTISRLQNNTNNSTKVSKWQGVCHLLPLILLVLLTVGACKRDEIEKKAAPMRRTVIVYMIAENTLHSNVQLDLDEMVSARKDIPEDCNLIVYVDDIGAPSLYRISAQGGKQLLRTYGEQDSATPEVFYQMLKGITQEFPAHDYGLVMWSHSSGWVPPLRRSFGIDNNANSRNSDQGTEMEISDMRAALERLGIHWNYIFFDSCFMQCVESAYELRQLTDHILGSPAEIPANGAPYQHILSSLLSADVRQVMQAYYDYYKDSEGLLLSSIQTNELEALLLQTKVLVSHLYDIAPTLNTQHMQRYCVYRYGSGWKPEYTDMGSVMHQLLSEQDYKVWEAQMHKTVTIRLQTPTWLTAYFGFTPTLIDAEHTALLSLFLPHTMYQGVTSYNEKLKDTQWYNDFVHDR